MLSYCQVTRIQTEIVKCHYRKQTCNLTVFNWVDDDALVIVSFPARHWVKYILFKYFKKVFVTAFALNHNESICIFKYFHKEFEI